MIIHESVVPSVFRVIRPTRINLCIWEYTMNQAQRSLCRALVLSCIVIGYASLGFGQTSDPKSSAIIEQIMTTALSRCYSTVNGVKRITFEPATDQEFAEVKALGQKAVPPLARYLDLQPKNGLTQLFAVKFVELCPSNAATVSSEFPAVKSSVTNVCRKRWAWMCGSSAKSKSVRRAR
jgi:hypothetical protein